MTEAILLRHAREFAILIGADPELTVHAAPKANKGCIKTAQRDENRRYRIPKEIEARAAAIRVGLGNGLQPRELARIFHCHPSEVLRPRPIPLTQQIERKGDLRTKGWNQ